MNPILPRRTITLIALAVVIGLGFGGYEIVRGNRIPEAFREARERGGAISERISSNASNIAKQLEHLSELEKQKKFDEADALIEELSKQKDEIKKDAVDLSRELEVMTKAVQGIRNDEAREAALEAVNSELSVITHLLGYSDFLGKLFGVIQNRTARNRDTQILGWLHEINSEVNQINEFNDKARAAFQKFDSLTK